MQNKPANLIVILFFGFASYSVFVKHNKYFKKIPNSNAIYTMQSKHSCKVTHFSPTSYFQDCAKPSYRESKGARLQRHGSPVWAKSRWPWRCYKAPTTQLLHPRWEMTSFSTFEEVLNVKFKACLDYKMVWCPTSGTWASWNESGRWRRRPRSRRAAWRRSAKGSAASMSALR